MTDINYLEYHHALPEQASEKAWLRSRKLWTGMPPTEFMFNVIDLLDGRSAMSVASDWAHYLTVGEQNQLKTRSEMLAEGLVTDEV